MITDYYSMSFDYLLLNKPIVFYLPDIEIYSRRRGFLLSPYEFWTPGPKAYTQDSLESAIIRILENPSWYEKERRAICDVVHYFHDANSSLRVWTLLKLVGENGIDYVKEKIAHNASTLFDEYGRLLI